MGLPRGLRSCSKYGYVHSRLVIHGVKLPERNVVQVLWICLKYQNGFQVAKGNSPLGIPCFSLKVADVVTQEFSNPYLRDHLVYIPELETMSKINCLSQSQKRCEGLDLGLCVQMVATGDIHFFLNELFQLDTGKIVVPIYFYQTQKKVLAKCGLPTVSLDRERVHINFQVVHGFHNPEMEVIVIKRFTKTFDRISDEEKVLLKHPCETLMFCEYLQLSFLCPPRNCS
ncbi:hypothetical protein CROQUDRAFT_36387 [Cronartium quercuum f. sp. fusiforme G11]|uniref:Uncharacterized protein n=1 Tax=Cronartium quercuum f. sp. fusiforme G11 TaxID=708437 RepID=A0A9P6TIH7_9BASI|nr:hypothetical protein CROQUDRAFT_36387 [Cronartium quercuum f. sp. fusiforme G11]